MEFTPEQIEAGQAAYTPHCCPFTTYSYCAFPTVLFGAARHRCNWSITTGMSRRIIWMSAWGQAIFWTIAGFLRQRRALG